MTVFLSRHQSLDRVGIHRNTTADQFAARLGHDRVVFNPDADIVEALVDPLGGSYIDAGLDGQYHSGAQC